MSKNNTKHSKRVRILAIILALLMLLSVVYGAIALIVLAGA